VRPDTRDKEETAVRRSALALMLLIPHLGSALAGTYYASPTGTPAGSGTYASPWNLAKALDNTVAQPGDTIFLRGGTYGSGGAAPGSVYTCLIDGSSGNPIQLRSMPGEWAVVNGGIYVSVNSTWVVFRDFEITNSTTIRTGSPDDRPYGLELRGRGHKVINMVIHDVGHPGIGFWEPVGDGGEINGTLLYHNGLYDNVTFAPDVVDRGSAIYAQNAGGTRYIKDIIAFRNFTTGGKAYSGGTSHANGFHFEGNTCFDNNEMNLFITAELPVTGAKFRNNTLYRRSTDNQASLQAGYSFDHTDVEVTDNYIVNGNEPYDGALFIRKFQQITCTGNTIIGKNLLAHYHPHPSQQTPTWNNNSYYGGDATPFEKADTQYSFSNWKTQTGFDAGSSFTAAYPTAVATFVRKNAYEAGRANITVYNWPKQPSVSVDVSGVLSSGDVYEVRDAQNYFASPIATGTYAGGSISVPVNQTTIAQPIGSCPSLSSKLLPTAPEFGAFVLMLKDPVYVFIEASDAAAAEFGQDPGEFTVRRTGGTASALTVNYGASGTATPGTDYTALSGSVTIPAGATSAAFTVTPANDASTEGDETVIATITSGSYRIDPTANSAAVTIADRFIAPPGTLAFDAEDATLSRVNPSLAGWNVIADAKAYGGQAIQADLSLGQANPNGVATISVTFSQAGTYQLYYRARTVDCDSDGLYTHEDSVSFPRGDLENVFSASRVRQNNIVQVTSFTWFKASVSSNYFIYTVQASEVNVPQPFVIETYDMGLVMDCVIFSTSNTLTAANLDNIANQALRDGNIAPTVDAGLNQVIISPARSASLDGTVSDDGKPTGGTLTQTWSRNSGPGTVTFANANAVDTTATFSALGTYELRLSAGDGELTASDTVTISVEPDLMLHLKLDETSGTVAADASGTGRDGAVAGAGWTGGAINGAAKFDEIDDRIVVRDFAMPADFSVSFWFRPTDNDGAGFQYMFSWGTVNAANSLNVYLGEKDAGSGGGNMLHTRFLDGNDSVSTNLAVNSAYADGLWHHYCLTVAHGTGAKVYIDGQTASSDPGIGGDGMDPATDLYLGGRNDLSPSRFYGGGLDDVRVHGRALASDEVRTLFDARIRGDFNGDGNVDIADVDAIYAVLGTNVPPADAKFDLTNDAKVDLADARELIQVIIGTSMADTNLDKSVDILDLGNLANRYGMSGGFGDGDTDGNGVIDIVDLGNLANDYGITYP
jgi:hypothetical protein